MKQTCEEKLLVDQSWRVTPLSYECHEKLLPFITQISFQILKPRATKYQTLQ